MPNAPPNPVIAPTHVLALLDRLHELSSRKEAELGTFLEADHKLRQADSQAADRELARITSDQLVALDKDKCHFMYQLIRSTGAKTVVEAGTGSGVSTIYLALAVGANDPQNGRVIATENEAHKAVKARGNWKECGEAVEARIDLREGNILETLMDCPEIDLLLLDIWAPLALPTLKLVEKKLRTGAVIITDNTISGAERYKDLLEHLRDPKSFFTNITLPYSNGLEMSVYTPYK
jgi:predicted O-methyltransferase YrrM